MFPVYHELSGIGIDPKYGDYEQGEAEMANIYAGACKRVLEIGGGKGKVSHYINKNLKDPEKHVVVDSGKWYGIKEIQKNRIAWDDKYTIINKPISSVTYSELSKTLGNYPDCIISDCEGCSYEYYKKNPDILKNVDIIINEMDGYNTELRCLWKDKHFRLHAVGSGADGTTTTEMWVKNGAKLDPSIYSLKK